MTEEQITKAILNWLESDKWEIICFDFPQSGTGVSLHQNPDLRVGKNLGIIIPDIVAIRNGIVAFFENKDRFVHSDFDKVCRLREDDDYSFSISRLLSGHTVEQIFYGVGLPLSKKVLENTSQQSSKIDFAIFVYDTGSVEALIDPNLIFKKNLD